MARRPVNALPRVADPTALPAALAERAAAGPAPPAASVLLDVLLELADARLGSGQRLILNQQQLRHQIGCRRLLADRLGDEALGVGFAWIGIGLLQTIEQPGQKVSFLRRHHYLLLPPVTRTCPVEGSVIAFIIM